MTKDDKWVGASFLKNMFSDIGWLDEKGDLNWEKVDGFDEDELRDMLGRDTPSKEEIRNKLEELKKKVPKEK